MNERVRKAEKALADKIVDFETICADFQYAVMRAKEDYRRIDALYIEAKAFQYLAQDIDDILCGLADGHSKEELGDIRVEQEIDAILEGQWLRH